MEIDSMPTIASQNLVLEPPAPIAALSAFDTISLAEMDEVALFDRVDSKFILTNDQLLRLLPRLTTQYSILSINQCRQHRYRTHYFDTAEFALYHRHHAGARQRYKVRSREYVDTQLAFFEVKRKINATRTIKHRFQTDTPYIELDDDCIQFMNEHGFKQHTTLIKTLWNNFTRITCVHRNTFERITFDIDLQFGNDDYSIAFPNIVISEIKQSSIDHQSLCMQHIRSLHIHETNFSKYCIGVALIYPYLKQNNLKPVLRRVFNLMGISYEQ